MTTSIISLLGAAATLLLLAASVGRSQGGTLRGTSSNHVPKHSQAYTDFSEADTQYWYLQARATLRERIEVLRPINRRAKNVIIFLGDGMSIATITAARILKGQLQGRSGEEGFLEFERFPHSALIKVTLSQQ